MTIVSSKKSAYVADAVIGKGVFLPVMRPAPQIGAASGSRTSRPAPDTFTRIVRAMP